MKILLANPPGKWLRCRWDIESSGYMKYYPYPVRLAYATSLLKQKGYDAHIIDATAEELTRKQFNKRVKEINPDVIIWETTASSFDYDIETMKRIRKILPDAIIVASGYHATPCYKECLKYYDFVIVGECDYSILELIKYLNKEIKEFPQGIVDRNHEYKPRPLIQNLDELPLPERESLPMKKYNDPKLKGFNVVMISSRGCPWGCNFCTIGVYYQQKNYRTRSPDKVVDEMEFLWKEYMPDELYFDDDNFAFNRNHVRGICEEILKRNLKMEWNCMADATIDFPTLSMMKKAGCSGITIGAENADDEILQQMQGKPINRKNIIDFVDNCRKLDIRSHVCWVLGMKGSTKWTDLDLINFAMNLKSDTLQFSICTPYIGTPFYQWCKERGYIVKGWKNFTGGNRAVVNYPNYSHEEIEQNLILATKLHHRKILTKRPDLIFHYLGNAYKNQGLKGMVNAGLRSLA